MFMKNDSRLFKGSANWGGISRLEFWQQLLAFSVQCIHQKEKDCEVLNSPNLFMKDIIFFWHCSIPIIFPFYQLAEPLKHK